MELNKKTVSAEIYRNQRYDSAINGEYEIRVPQGFISYVDDHEGRLLRNFVTIWSKLRHGEINPSWDHLRDVDIPEFLIDELIRGFYDKVSPANSELRKLNRERMNLCTTILNINTSDNPFLVFHPAIRASFEAMNRNDRQEGIIEEGCEEFYTLIQRMHEQYIIN